MATTPTVSIPLKLELDAVQGQLNNLKQQINKTVSPDTTAYKQLVSILGKAESSFIKISALSKESFRSQSDIDGFKKQLQSLMTTVNSLGVKFNTLNFKDLGLDDTPELENFRKQIETVQNRIKALNNQKIGDIFDNSAGEAIKNLAKALNIKMNKNTGFDKLIKDFDTASAAAKESVNTQVQALQALEKEINNFNDKPVIDLAEYFKKNSVPNDTVTDVLDFETVRKNFEKRFSEAFGRTDFPELIQKALNNNAENITTIDYLDGVIEAVKASKDELVVRKQEWEAELKSLVSQSQAIDVANTQVKQTISSQSSESNINNLLTQVASLTQRIRELENQLASTAKKEADMDKETGGLTDNLKEMGEKSSDAARQLRELTDAQEKISNIKMAIKNWLGFSEVVNIAKNALRDAYTTIKDLDSVMTEIAVVTDMTQAELWDQMETYSSIAKQYGATTRGVYEVSQLYYQAGRHTVKYE